MSRMDILTPSELNELIDSSALLTKYNEKIDRESAYEILTAKIERADAEKAREKAKTERKEVSRAGSRKTSRKDSNTTEKAIIKVLTSATFIRGVMGVLNKLMK